MKLKNKKTGEIRELPDGFFCGDNLEKICEEWEDYKDSKDYWCIDWTGGLNHITVLDDLDKYEENKKEIGNYFATKEEAEKAVEKLKAWKRLKDKGLKFDLDFVMYRIDFTYNRSKTVSEAFELSSEIFNDMKLLIGDEE